MIQVAKAIFYKEVREVLRDKRTLLLALIVPLLFYPVLVSVSLLVNEKPESGAETQLQKVRVGIPDRMPKIEGVEWVRASKLPDFNEQVFLERKGQDTFLLDYRPSLAGENQKNEIVRLLELHREKLIQQKLVENGIDPFILHPFDIEVSKSIDMRGEVSLKYGGAAAYFIIFLAFTGCMSVAVDAGAGERERGTLEAMMSTPASLLGVGLGKLLFVVMIGLLSVISTGLGLLVVLFFVPELRVFIGEILDWRAGAQLAVLMASVVVLFGAGLYGISLLAKSTREAHLRASLLMMLVAVALIMAGSEQLTHGFWSTFVPIMNVSIAVSDALGGVLTWEVCLIVSAVCLSLSFLILYALSFKLSKNPERIYLAF